MSRNRIIIGVVLIVIIIAALAITRPWTYFIVNKVNEEFPAQSTSPTTDENPEPHATVTQEIADEPASTNEETDTMDDATMTKDEPETAESAEPVALASGSFITIDPVHGAEGTATIYELADGSRILRFEDLDATNGPDLHVFLSKEIPTNTFDGVGDDALDLGELKGNVGNQNYDIPADVDVTQFKSVVIYCVPFGVTFSSAALSA